MIKTIIVDDEVWVCKLICNIVDWGSYGYEVVRQVYSGTEALEVIAAESRTSCLPTTVCPVSTA